MELPSIPDDPHFWHVEQYEEFLTERRKRLATELNAFLSGITAAPAAPMEVSLEEMIAEGENEDVEFKSSLRWDYKLEQPNKKLEDVILKTVAAFANCEGGTLLIGVKDDGEILGLDRDYGALGGADKDKYELHLRNLLNDKMSKGFAAQRVRADFPTVDGKEICRVAVERSRRPIFLVMPDRNGQPAEKFFVRSGNSSQDLSMSEAQTYIDEHFD